MLPLESASPDPKDGYLAGGITKELVTVLSQVRGLRVISHASGGRPTGAARAITGTGMDLEAPSVLEGRVQKSGDRLRVAVRLTDPESDKPRWEQVIVDDLERVLTVRGELAEGAVGALNVRLRDSERDAFHHRPTSSLAAYDAYLRGIEGFRRELSGSRGAGEVAREAWADFERAIRLDPQFAAAYAYLANHLIALMEDGVPTREVVAEIRALTAKALDLSPDLADAHIALGNLATQADHDWKRAGMAFRRAIALNPSSSAAHFWYGNLLGFLLQRHREATKEFRTAIDLDPQWLFPRYCLIWTRVDSGDLASAISDCKTTARLFPDSASVRVTLAWCYGFEHRDREALELATSVPGLLTGSIAHNPTGVLAYLGRTERARALLSDWEANRLKDFLSPIHAAGLYALLGEGETALALLEREFREREFCSWGSYQGPWFDSIRSDLRFVSLLRDMKLPTGLTRPLWLGRLPVDGRRARAGPSRRRTADRPSTPARLPTR